MILRITTRDNAKLSRACVSAARVCESKHCVFSVRHGPTSSSAKPGTIHRRDSEVGMRTTHGGEGDRGSLQFRVRRAIFSPGPAASDVCST